jgi:hypothetical protein
LQNYRGGNEPREAKTGRWVGSSPTAVVVTFGGAPPPSVKSTREVLARWIDDASSASMAATIWAKIHTG